MKMEYRLHHLFSSLIFLLLAISPSSSYQSQINVWPKPVKVTWPNLESAYLSSSFDILSPYEHKYLQLAIHRYRQVITNEKHEFIGTYCTNKSSSPPIKFLSLSIQDSCSPLEHGVDETYSLRINTDSTAYLKAGTVWGAMHGLETFSQLVYLEGNQLMVPVDLYIEDGPIFPHRGVMLDTGRNYYARRDIMRTIKAMSYNKLNVFHWHITDSNSFPIVLPSEYALAKKGSYGHKMQYTPTDVRAIVEYGMQYGVRVVPEIDTPGQFYRS